MSNVSPLFVVLSSADVFHHGVMADLGRGQACVMTTYLVRAEVSRSDLIVTHVSLELNLYLE